MTRKNLAAFISAIVVFSVASGLVAYRMGLRRGRTNGFTSQASTNSASAQSGCVDFHDAASLTGRAGCVTGRVLRVYTSRSGTTFLDFCSEYRSCPFTSVIFSSDRNKFGNLQSLVGRRIEIHGEITSYQGRPEIIIRGPDQIRKAD